MPPTREGVQGWPSARDPEKAELAAKKLSGEGLDVLYHAVDVSEDKCAGRHDILLEEEIGKLDVLVNKPAAYVN